ncbi:hypothetical protein [Nonomuraea sp. NPDC003804]|uniref:hypothetical protein n=1 Tax=Nonomuraea sp. NPDC003804 TaxID=3154547 RepID=UPI0033A96638
MRTTIGSGSSAGTTSDNGFSARMLTKRPDRYARSCPDTHLGEAQPVAGLDVYFQALDECAGVAANAAKVLIPADILPDKTPPPSKVTDADVFGKYDNSQNLAADIDTIWRDHITGELGEARAKLGGVERALDKVQANIRAADQP